MRKAQRKKVENLIELLSQAHREIRAFVENKNDTAALELLRQCQGKAVELGEFIEKAENESAVTISFLEDYCELVYQIYEELAGGQEIRAGKVYKKLHLSLIRVENSLQNDIKTRYEIVFMPYKASMWDSLESVWQAAQEDPDCDAYVVPIPYYDRNFDYSFGQFHYEGGDFPDYVEVIDYRTYDLNQRRPDIIYIHNPYDEHNYVTSVAPQFYSSELKKYTECLVYIPYCVYAEPDSPDQEETIEYCSRYISPVLLRADQIIFQSENFRRAIVNMLVRYCGIERTFWERRIVALGSPKYDKVQSVSREQQEMINSWGHLFTKPDGSRKKVIFYNTSLNALLKYGEQMNRKIRSVLRFFYEKRDECTLLWRPHPLVKATIESMYPALWAGYREIVDAYRAEGWGIYDDSPDFHAAVVASDAYYGDFSSLLLLYQATGKPVLGQNMDVLDYKERFVTNRLYHDGEYIWGAAWEFNGLFRIDPATGKVSYMGQFPKEEPEGYGLFLGIAECGGRLYLCPHNAKHIAVYDKKSGRFGTIVLKEDIRDIDKKFSGILREGKYIYMQGGYAHTIVRLDTETDQIIYIDNWLKKMQELRKEKKGCLFAKDGCIYEGNLYYICCGIGYLLRITLDNFNYEFIPVEYKGEGGFRGVYNTDGLFWLMPIKKGHVICFDLHTSILREVFPLEEGTDMCRINSYIYFFSRAEQHFYRVDINSKEVTKFPINESVESVCTVENKIFIFTSVIGRLYVLDSTTFEVTKMDLLIDQKELPELHGVKMLENNRKYNQYAREAGCVNLELLLEKGIRDFTSQSDQKVDFCGKEIHKYMKGLVE